MTKRGEGARALGAAYMSALMGGLFGAVLWRWRCRSCGR